MKERKAKFSGHQTFVVRYGWLEKGYRFIKDELSFTGANAIVELGVGKNMVASIRYWAEVCQIIEGAKPSDFATKLLDENGGWDPYLEDDNSYWLLHWKLNTHPEYIHSGTILFSHLRKHEFSKIDVADAAYRQLDSLGQKSPAESVMSKDIDCYLRLYTGTKRQLGKKQEQLIGSPFEELGLIHPVNNSDLYSFNIGRKPNLAPEIVGYALWEYMKRLNKEVITINEALYYEFCPGVLFMLDENSLIEAIEELSNSTLWAPYFGFSEGAGVALIKCSLEDGDSLLDEYYRRTM